MEVELNINGFIRKKKKKTSAIWESFDRLTKTTYCIAKANTWTLDQLAESYSEVIIYLNGLPSSVASNQQTIVHTGFS